MASALPAETTSRLKNIGMHISSAPITRATGLTLATNHEGEAGRDDSGRASIAATTTDSPPSRAAPRDAAAPPGSKTTRRASKACTNASSCVTMTTAEPLSRTAAISCTISLQVVKS